MSAGAATAPPRLLGDIGGTNARFTLLGADGGFQRGRDLAGADYATLEQAMAAYLDEALAGDPPERRPRAAALAVASPVDGDRVALTNRSWTFSIEAMRERFGLERLVVLNDFAANALAVPSLAPADRLRVGGGEAVRDAPVGVIGPGSGLGVGGLLSAGGLWRAISGEGGHATMSPASLRESAVLDRMRGRFDHVSAERVLSGPGLVNLYSTLAEIDGVPAAPYTPAQIADPATGRSDARCREALEMFCAMLGTVAGNLALTLGARGGIYIAGGIVPRLGDAFASSGFRRRFEDKGRFASYLARIPTFVITHPHPAYLGLARTLAERAPPDA